MSTSDIERRHFLRTAAQIGTGLYVGSASNLFASDLEKRISIPHGAASGDVSSSSAVLWSRADRPAKMLVELSTTESFETSRRLVGPLALEHSDYTSKLGVANLKPGTTHFYRIRFQDLDGRRIQSEPVVGKFRTAPTQANKDVTFLWSGDTAGQGYGIDESRGGMLTYETMRQHSPDFFVHSGDTCYSDNPFPETLKLDDGSVWNNLVTPETSKVAETLNEFRANQRYNLHDANVRKFNAEVPIFAQWDDHETTNNWYPGERLDDPRYQVKSASLLAARAKRAFMEYMPIRSQADRPTRIHRVVPYGPLLDLFFLDLRSFRGRNSKNDQTEQGFASSYLGKGQLTWLKEKLKSSTATWKVICSDMPIGMMVRDGENFENCANGDGAPMGRELEIADLLQFMKRESIRNAVWITADVHYAASHYYDPNKAIFQAFDPFWEFVSGPLHAGTFGPSQMDNTFGPQVRFNSIPKDMKPNRPPSEGLQFFGKVHIDAASKAMTVSHINRDGNLLWTTDIDPE